MNGNNLTEPNMNFLILGLEPKYDSEIDHRHLFLTNCYIKPSIDTP